MTYINLPGDQQQAIGEVDEDALRAAVDKCLYEERVGPIQGLGLSNCGPYVATAFRRFEKAIGEYANAKSHKKQERTKDDARRAGSDLISAVQQMKGRVEAERQEGELFYIDDHIQQPFHLTNRLSVRVSFRWRPAVAETWKHGSITYTHDYSPAPDYSFAAPKRKPSAASAARDLEHRLYEEWERLKMQALFSVKEHFRDGGSGDAVPKTYAVRPGHGGGLNNHSCNFWRTD